MEKILPKEKMSPLVKVVADNPKTPKAKNQKGKKEEKNIFM